MRPGLILHQFRLACRPEQSGGVVSLQTRPSAAGHAGNTATMVGRRFHPCKWWPDGTGRTVTSVSPSLNLISACAENDVFYFRDENTTSQMDSAA